MAAPATDGVERLELEVPRGALRVDEHAIQFIKSFILTGRPIGAICHGPSTLLEAAALDGDRMTSWSIPRTEPRSAEADWVEGSVVIDRARTISRSPSDRPAFRPAVVEQSAE